MNWYASLQDSCLNSLSTSSLHKSLLERDPVIVYRVMRAILRVVHVILNRLAMQTSELTNYVFKVHGKY
jgi:CRP/FNR family cyclic AMP-dependent transcriptional regulator